MSSVTRQLLLKSIPEVCNQHAKIAPSAAYSKEDIEIGATLETRELKISLPKIMWALIENRIRHRQLIADGIDSVDVLVEETVLFYFLRDEPFRIIEGMYLLHKR